MEFHSLFFLFRWLPIILLCYRFFFRSHFRSLFLLVVSLLFYAWGEPLYVFLLLTLTFIHWQLGKEIQKNGKIAWMWLGIALDLFLLVYFKYYPGMLDFIASHLTLSYDVLPQPLGISYYMFTLIAYLADVGRRQCDAQQDFVSFALYICFFPRLLMGPLMSFQEWKKNFDEGKKDPDLFHRGACCFMLGLAQKVILSTWMSALFQTMGDLPLSFVSAWGKSAAFALQLYFDFNGYSLMAFGLAAMLDVRIPFNFRYPYLSKSVSEFWRCWHITLGLWFRNYVYIPLGGSRKGNVRTAFNLLAVWLLTAFWHGSTVLFLLWGLYHYCWILAERFLLRQRKRLPNAVQIILTLCIVVVGWVFFYSKDLPSAFATLRAMADITTVDIPVLSWIFKNYGTQFIIAAVACTPLVSKIAEKMSEKNSGFAVLQALCYVLLFTLSLAFLIGGSYQPFLYSAF